MTEQDWAAALDDLEQQLAGHRGLLARAACAGALPWSPPLHLGPLPTACLPRARALLAQLDQVVEQLAQARACTGRELRLHRALPFRGGAAPSYVDVRG